METNSTTENPLAMKASKKNLLINRNFGLLVVGQGISQFGDFIFTFTLMVWLVAKVAVGQTWAPLAISALLFSAYVPYFVIGPWAGVFVDRWLHRRTMMMMNAIRAIMITLLIIGTGAIPLPWQPSPLFLIVIVCIEGFLDSTCGQFFNPASNGLIGQIVPQEELARAEGLSQTLSAAAKLIGPLLAPLLYFAVGIFWGLLINALSFVVSLLTLRAIHVSQTQEPVQGKSQPNFWREFVAGLGFSVKGPVIRVLIVAIMITMLGAGSLDALMLFFLQRNLHASLSFTGLLITPIGLGTIVGGLFFGSIGERFGLKRLLWLSLLGVGLLFAIFSRLSNFWLALVLLLPVGALLAALNIASNALIIGETPKALIGRVSAVVGSLAMLANTLSIVLGGYLASVVLVSLDWHVLGTTFRAVDAVYMATGIVVFLAGLYALVALRDVARKTAASTEPEENTAAPVETQIS